MKIHKLERVFLMPVLLILLLSPRAQARLIFADDVFVNMSETFRIGSDDDAAGTDLILEFGETNAESITWSSGSTRFDVSDDVNVTGGVTASDTITANGTLDANGTVTLGDNGDTIALDSSIWDISSAGVASGLTGLTSTGGIDFNGASAFRIREDSDPATNAACSTLNELIVDTTDNEVQICTATGGAGAATWTAVGGGSTPDFEAVYAADTGNNLVTSDAIFTITTGTSDFVVDSNDWNVTAAGALDAATLAGANLTASGGVIYSDGSVLQDSAAGSTGQVLISGGTGSPTWTNVPTTLVWYLDGDISTGATQGATVTMPFAFTVTDIDLKVETAPTGASLIVDINEAGTTIYSTRPEIDASSTVEDGNEVVSDSSIASGAEVTLDIDQVGSTVAGADLTVMLHGTRTY